MEDLKTELRNAGHKVIDPWELGEKYLATFRAHENDFSNKQRITELHRTNNKIARINAKAISNSEAVVACLDGSDVDSGTASEIGFAFGKGKKIFGYRGDFRLTGENEAATVNIQVQYWIEESKGKILRTVPDLVAALAETKQNSPSPRPRPKNALTQEDK